MFTWPLIVSPTGCAGGCEETFASCRQTFGSGWGLGHLWQSLVHSACPQEQQLPDGSLGSVEELEKQNAVAEADEEKERDKEEGIDEKDDGSLQDKAQAAAAAAAAAGLEQQESPSKPSGVMMFGDFDEEEELFIGDSLEVSGVKADPEQPGPGESGAKPVPKPAPKPAGQLPAVPPAPESGKAGKGKGGKGKGAGGKGAGGTAKKQCRGCWKLLPLSSFPIGKEFCWMDNRALDNIYRRVKASGEQQWWQHHRFDDARRTHMLKRYHELHPEVSQEARADSKGCGGEEAGGKGRHKGKRQRGTGMFDIAQFKEEVKIGSDVMQDRYCKDFTRAEFESHKVCPCSQENRGQHSD